MKGVVLALGFILCSLAGWGQDRTFVSAGEVRPASYAGKEPRFRALIYYSDQVEEAHQAFTHQAIGFFRKLTVGDGFVLDVDTRLPEDLSIYDVVIMPDVAPGSPEERARFQQYMEDGGGWVGFHAAGTRNLPERFVAPASEFYQWTPDPRSNPAVEVLVSLAPENFPMGLKDVVFGGDFPVVWTNRNYRMIYLNMGHGDECFSDATQNLLFVNALRWVVSTSPKGDPFER